MVATIQVQTTTGSNFAIFAGNVLASIQSVTPNGFPNPTAITVLGTNGDVLRFTGEFTISAAGAIIGGTATGLAMRDNGAPYVIFGNFSVDAVAFYNAVTGPNPSDVLDLIGDLRFTGNDGIDFGAGASGEDDLSGGLGDDVLDGNEGDDIVDGGGGGDTMSGGAQIDTLSYAKSTAAVKVNLGAGTAAGGDAAGDIFVGFENLQGSDHNDKLSGNGGVNVLDGRDGNDTLRGSGGADSLLGGFGSDTIDYLNSTNGVTINIALGTAAGGHAAGDTFSNVENVRGSDHDDTITGDAGKNTFHGEDGDDTLLGGAGNDKLLGGNGQDRLDGGKGNDKRTGGVGADTFVLHKLGSAGDHILDFTAGIDTLEVNAAEFGGGLAAGVALSAIQLESNTTGEATDNDHRFILNTTNGQLWYDSNGAINGTSGSRLIATFDGPVPLLTIGDIDIV